MLFARRRSSLSNDKFSCLNIAFLTTCCLLVIVGHVQSMSLDRLGSATRQARQFQQKNDKQLEFSESMVPEAESELLQNDMELVPAVDGLSDMYLLVPAAAGSNADADQQSIEEEHLQSLENTEQQRQQVSLTPANEESNSDMLMLESDDTPAVQILELPQDVLETKLVEDVMAQESEQQQPAESQAKEEQSENMMDTLAEAVQEIKNEIETELVEQPSEEEKAEEGPQVNEEIQQLNEMPADNTDTSVENLSALGSNNSEQEMIGVVKEEPEKIVEQVNEVMDMQADESEVQPMVMEMNNESQDHMPAVMEMSNESQDQMPAEENKIEQEEAALMSQEMSEEKIETVSNEASEIMENVKPIEETEAEMEKTETEEQHQDDQDVNEDVKNDSAVEQETVNEALAPEKEEIEMNSDMKIEMPAVEETLAEDVHANEKEMEDTPTELQADDETPEAMEVSEEKPQEIKAETVVETMNEESPAVDEIQMPVEAVELDKELSAEVTQSDDELQQPDSNENSADKIEMAAEENPEEEVMKAGTELIAESQTVNVGEEEEEKPIEDHMQPEMVEENQQVEETKAEIAVAEEVSQDINEQNDDAEPTKEENKESAVVEENQTQNLEHAQSMNDNQVDQTAAETEQAEAQVDGEMQTLEETQPVKEIETVVVAEAVDEPDTLPEAVEEYQPMEEVQNVQHDVEEAQPMEEVQILQDDLEAQPIEEVQTLQDAVEEVQSVVPEIQAMNDDAQPMEEVQPAEETQAVEQQHSMEEVQAIVEDKPMEEAQAMEEVQALQDDVEEVQPVANEIQAMIEDAQPMEDMQPMEEAQPAEEIQAMIEDAQPMEEIQSMEETQPAEEVQSVNDVKPLQNIEPLGETEEVQSVEEMLTLEQNQPMDKIETEVEEIQTVDDIKPLEDSQNLINEQPMEEAQTESENKAEELQTPVEIQADEDSQDVNVAEAMVEDIKPVEIVAETQSLAEEAEPVEHHETVISEEKPAEIIAEESVDTSAVAALENEEKPAEVIAEESVDTPAVAALENEEKPAEAIEEESVDTPAVAALENEEKPPEISVDELVDDEISAENENDNQKQEVQPIILADEDTLQNVETIVEEEQKDKQNNETPEAEMQKPLEDKDSDNILNDDTNESETTSMLTTIVQVPTKEEQTQTEQQETIVETTFKPLNVLDSVLNYVNASFMNQMNNENNDATIKPEVEAEEQAFSSKLRRYDGAQVWRIVVQNDKERKLADELQTKYDGQLWKEVKQEVDYLLKPNVLADAEKHVKAANLSRIVLIDNLQKVIEVENPPPSKIAEYQYRNPHPLTWKGYHRLQDIHSFYLTMARLYSNFCSVETIGYSIEKRPLMVLKISNGNPNNPSVWIDGGMHAREWISPAVVTYVANQIIEDWENLPAYMRNINWYIHAVANPDGYEYSHTTDRLWRKNMRSHGRACPGVDLNRNFGYKWGGKGTSANPCAQTYRGSKAFSEPETFYISKFISSFPRDTFKAYLSFHSYGQYILYPWGYDYHITKDMADLDLVARQAGTIITKSTGAKYTVGSSANTLYPAAGGSDDWAKGIAGIKYAYTIEMGDTGRFGFVLPAEYIEPNGQNGYTFVETIGKAITMGKNARRRKLKAHNKIH